MDRAEEYLDPETEFLLSKREMGNEWELFKENVRPLKRGRKVELLNHSLKSHNHNLLKTSLLDNRRFFFWFLFILSFSILSLYIYLSLDICFS